jgi:hypothetical protein
MSENLINQAVQPSYEEVRDSAPTEARTLWQAADKEEENLRTLYGQLKDDPRYTEEHKSAQAWEKYEAKKQGIIEGKEKARETLSNNARAYQRMSLPFPPEEGPVTKDNEKLLLSQNEASRIVRKLERISNTKGPFKQNPTKVLKEEYERGLEVGGVQGGSICRGVLTACDEFGVDVDSVVDDFRKERHRELLEDSQRAELLTNHIGKRVPEPPFKPPAGTTRSLTALGVGASGPGGRRRASSQPAKVSQRHW